MSFSTIEPVKEAHARRRLDAGDWLIVALVAAAYLPAMGGGFIWDDDEHVSRSEIRSLHGLYRIWFDVGSTQQYFPLLHSAFWLEHHLWGDWPPAYHALNVALHIGAALLVRRVMRPLLDVRSAAWVEHGAWLTAAIFALHPVHVESVAWISEQKNTLSAIFYLLAIRAYLRFDVSRGTSEYGHAIIWFLLSLLTKSVTATLPAALLVMLWWRAGRLQWRRHVWPILPMLLLGIASGLFTTWVEHDVIGAKGAGFDRSMLERVMLSGRIAWEYLCKLFWPFELLVIYPLWQVNTSDWRQWIYTPALCFGLLLLAFIARNRRSLLAGTLFYFGTLLPVIGFINCYLFLFAFNFDHFQYLASLGILAMVGCGVASFAGRLHTLRQRQMTVLALPILLGILTLRQASLYANPKTLYEHTLKHNPEAGVVHNNLAVILWNDGRRDDAIRHYERAVSLHPEYAKLLNNLGKALSEVGRNREAIILLQRALDALPHYPNAMNNLTSAYLNDGRIDDAVACGRRAVEMAPDNALFLTNYGVALGLAGRHRDAADQFEKALRDRPGAAEIQWNLARAYEQCGRWMDATAVARQARSLAIVNDNFELVRIIDSWLVDIESKTRRLP